jgi:aldehyde dehydrogenase (NAD+)
VAFTGSVPTGRKIAVAAAESNLKKVGLELGGKSPVLIFKSADIEQAAKWTATAIWFNSGQDCTAGSRVYIQEEVYDEFIGALKGLAAETAVGFVSFRDMVRTVLILSLKTRRLRSALWYVAWSLAIM